jgi:hypothetical protein
MVVTKLEKKEDIQNVATYKKMCANLFSHESHAKRQLR